MQHAPIQNNSSHMVARLSTPSSSSLHSFYGTTPFKSTTGSSSQTDTNITSVSYVFPDEQSCSAEARELMTAIFVLSERYVWVAAPSGVASYLGQSPSS